MEAQKMSKRKIDRQLRLCLNFLLIGALLQACDLTINIFPEPAPPQTVPEELPENQVPPQSEQEEIEPEQNQQQGQDNQWLLIDHGGVELWYDPQVILEIEASTIPREEGGMQEPHPAYVQYALPMDSGAISVVEIDAYKNMSEVAVITFLELQALIFNQNLNYLECVPELPLVAFYHECSRQQLTANIEFIDFRNGSGVRFVTVYAIQDTVPVSNEHLVYTFQGVSDDQQCYLKAGFRLIHRDIPDYSDYGELPEYDDEVGTALGRYFGLYEAQLSGTPEGYSPALTRFDTIISSIEISSCMAE
jgi:hypothetical protein